MVTPPNGATWPSVPVNAEGARWRPAWNLAADNAAGNQCKAFGVGGIMRQPGRIRISWQDDSTLKMEFDAGTQTRLLHFDRAAQPPARRRHGRASPRRVGRPGRRSRPGEAPRGSGRRRRRAAGAGRRRRRACAAARRRDGGVDQRGGDIKVVDDELPRRATCGRTACPYSEQATITEYFHRLPTHPNGDSWLNVVTIVEDPRYLTQPFYTSTNFRLEANDSLFNPTPCQTAAPLPVTKK